MCKLTIVVALAMATMARSEPNAQSAAPTLDLPLEEVITKPDWRVRPTSDQVSAAYPKIAQMLRLEGRAEIVCTAEADGAVDDCRVASETPVGLGFGAAAIGLGRFFQMSPATIDGRSVGSKVNIPIRFRMSVSDSPEPLPPVADANPAKLALAHEIIVLEKDDETVRRQYHEWLDGMVNAAVQSGETRPSLEVIDAFEAGIDDVSLQIVDRAARQMAIQMPEDQLRSIRDFLQTPPGQAFVNARRSEAGEKERRAISDHLPWTVRDRVCAKIACLTPAK